MMAFSFRKAAFLVLAMALHGGASGAAVAQETFKYGSPVNTPNFYLPVLAAQEQGFFKKNGVKIEWLPSQSGPDMQRAMAAGAIKIASSQTIPDLLSIARGVPLVIVGQMQTYDDFALWVITSGKVKRPEDLKGARIGVSRFGGTEHSYAQLIASKLGYAKDIQFVATGGIRESLAMLTTGGIDAVVLTISNLTDLKLQGRVTEILKVKDYLPKDWLAYTILASRDFVDKDPETARKIVQSLLEANRYLMDKGSKDWAVAKIKEMSGYSTEAAELIYGALDLSTDGKVSKTALDNVAQYMVDHQQLKASEVPGMEKAFTDKLLK